jgi:hypothetical protein
METQQMELLLARMNANTKANQDLLARMDANIKAMKEMMKEIKEDMNANRKADREDLKEMREEIKSGQVEIRCIVNAWIVEMKKDRKETMSCQATTVACLDNKELNPEDMKYEVEHREVPMEEVTVKSSGTMKKRHRGRHLVAWRREETKELTQGDYGSRRKLAAACRKVSRHAKVAWRKRNAFRKIRTQGNY